MGEIAQLIAIIATGLWSGALAYVSVVEHPATLEVGAQFAIAYFRSMAKRGRPILIALAVIGAAAGIVAWVTQGNILWLIGGVVLIGMLPLTAIFIVPTNRRLLRVNAVQSPDEANDLLKRWGRLHAMRTILGLIPFLLFVWALFSA